MTLTFDPVIGAHPYGANGMQNVSGYSILMPFKIEILISCHEFNHILHCFALTLGLFGVEVRPPVGSNGGLD